MPIAAYPYRFSDWYGYDKDCVGKIPFSASVTSDPANVCSLSVNQTFYHNGNSGTNPVVGNTVYSDIQGQTKLANGSYQINTQKYIVVNSVGLVTAVNDCTTTTPVSLYFGNSPANACWYSGSLNSYFSSNPTLGSGANARIFTDAAGNNPVTQSGAYVVTINSPGSANEIICVDSNGYVTSLAPSAGTCTAFPGTGSTCPT